MHYSIFKQSVLNLIKSFQKDHTIFAPVKRGETDYIFAENPDLTEIAFHYPLTILPPKKIFLPPKELLLTGGGVETTGSVVSNQDIRRPSGASLPQAEEKTLLFGVHLCDIHGVLYLDKAMMEPFVDEWYKRRRANSVIIGISDLKQSRYLTETFAPDVYSGFDLFLELIDQETYLAIPGSDFGEKLIQTKFFEETDFHPGKVTPPPAISKKDPVYLAEVINQTMDFKVWDDLAERCIDCGICVYVCPVCYCTDNIDSLGLANLNCQRCRNWSACMLPHFSKMAGGIDPRKSLRERYRNWYYHKFVRSAKEYGQVGCIGCGRCVHFCPAKINFMEVLAELESEYESSKLSRMGKTSKLSN